MEDNKNNDDKLFDLDNTSNFDDIVKNVFANYKNDVVKPNNQPQNNNKQNNNVVNNQPQNNNKQNNNVVNNQPQNNNKQNNNMVNNQPQNNNKQNNNVVNNQPQNNNKQNNNVVNNQPQNNNNKQNNNNNKQNNNVVNNQLQNNIVDHFEVRTVEPKSIISVDNVANNNVLSPSYDVNRVNEIKKKENNVGLVTFDDGIDEDVIYNKGIRGFLSNRKVISTVLVLAFVFVCIVVAKAFYFGNKVDKYEEFFIEIDHKIDEEVKAYAGQELDNVALKKVAASELVSCIGSKVDFDNLSDGVKNAIRDINNYYNSSYNNFAFAYKDIYTGFTVTYNENQDIFTASTIKAPTDIYIWEMASQGKIDLDKELTYTPKQFCRGSGSLQYKKMYTKYKTRELLRLSTVISDNVAHNILMDNYGRVNMLNFWKEKGTKSIFKYNTNWGSTNAHDALIYMSELYRFYTENDEYGNQVMTNFLNAAPKFVKGKNGYKVANKSGWTGSAIHDASIIFADNPYIIIALSNTGNGNYMSYFNKANDLAYKLHTEYWKYKMSLCEEIKQY